MSKKRVMSRDIRANPLPINRNAGASKAAEGSAEFAARNLALYRRNGFEILGTADFDELRQYSLWRPTIAQVEPGAATGTPIR